MPPSSPIGATYSWLDENVQAGLTYYYRLAAVDVYGLGTFYGPIAAAVPADAWDNLPIDPGKQIVVQ